MTEADLERLLAREFLPEQTGEARVILARYGVAAWQREPVRVRVAALKLAAGDLEQLDHFIEVARADYRDVLAWAEYPAYLQRPLGPADEREAREAVDADWRQYKDWFEK